MFVVSLGSNQSTKQEILFSEPPSVGRNVSLTSENALVEQITFNAQYAYDCGKHTRCPGHPGACGLEADHKRVRRDEAFAQRNIAPERKEEAQAFLAAVGVGTGNDV